MKKSLTLPFVKKISIFIFIFYILASILFYFIAGRALFYKKSDGNIEMPDATSGSIELIAGTTVEQTFNCQIDQITEISIKWGTFGRSNNGNILVELVKNYDGTVLASEFYNASEIAEGEIIYLRPDIPIIQMNEVPLVIRITADSIPGQGASPLINHNIEETDGEKLFYTGIPVNGKLCFSVSGEDTLWLGSYYWILVFLFLCFLIIYLTVENIKIKNNKKSMLFQWISELKHYKFLISQLVSRDFKSKYKRSILGVFWSFLNPLLTMTVQYMVFSNLFRFDIPNYAVYLLTGIVVFNFFSEAVGMSISSIIGNANLITKVYVPKYIYPLTRVLTSIINMAISMIPLFIVVLCSGILPSTSYILLLFDLLCLAVFSFGLGLILATSMVFFRDTQFLWGIVNMIWMYFTPLFYPESILPENILWVLKLNPLYYYVTFARTCIIDRISPEPMMYLVCFIYAFMMFIIGAFIFKKKQDKFILYL